MAINFPDSPSVNDTVTQGDHTWIWDGTTWKLAIATAIAPAGSNTQVQYNSSGAFAGSANLTFDGSTIEVNSGTENLGLKVTSTDEYALISFADDGATGHGYAALGGSDNALIFFAGGNARMTIDSNGLVQTPQIPAFRVANTSGSGGYIYNGSVSGAGTIVFGSDSGYGLYDNGNNYNTSTGIFTAPVDGYYFFTSTIFMHTSYDNDTDCYWGISSSNGVVTTNHGTKGEDGGQTVSGIFYLDAGDTAKAYVNSSLDLYSWRTEQYNSFQGILLG